ncbi:hypothetical protein F66182_5749 [Fusarium sp. NRRL 66182]|nr:hypothetical protein F66182_5749 [Fusarium sp. NRRL 66182]
MSAYTYSPVKASEIRLITLTQTGPNGQLRGSIRHEELNPDDPIKYTALSYCWGDPSSRVQLPCDGKLLSITTSLYEALPEVIKFSPHGAVWIDQICINQEDMTEKAEQVSKMNQIYDKAETVVAWLGPAVESTERAVDFVRRVGDVALPTATDMFRWDNYGDRHEETKLERVEQLTEEQSRELGIPFDDDESWNAFSQFFDRAWFQRIWTVQEIIQARKAIVVCGAHSLPWEHVSAAARWFCHKAKAIHDNNSREVDGMCLVTQMVAIPWRAKLGSEYYPQLLSQKTRPTCKWSLLDLLEGLRPRLATDPRDKVYGLLGITDIDRRFRGDEGIEVDYSLSVKDVYTCATDEIIQLDTSDLNVIWSARQRNKVPGWPSWVPDWRLKTGTGCAWGIGAPLKASGQPNGQHSYIATTEPHSLVVRGRVVGRVVYTSEYRHFGELFQQGGLRNVYSACMERLDAYPTGEAVKTAFGLTMMGGLPLTKALQKAETSLETYTDEYMAFFDVTQMPTETENDNAARGEALKKCYKLGFDRTWIEEVLNAYCERRFVVTDTGYMGLAHHEVLEGDSIVVVDDDVEDADLNRDAYCHGVMNGEAVQDIAQEDSDKGQLFTLK